IIDGSTIAEGDVVLGLASSGIHSNGFSLVRKIIERANPDLNAPFDGRTLADALIAPTRIYVKPLLALMAKLTVKGMAHITGGGLVENIPRVLREGLTAELDQSAWTLPPLFQWLQEHGGVADAEMHRVFNCGIGMAVIVSAADADAAVAELSAAGEQVWKIGRVRASREGEAQTVVV
ncbi:MAG: AIR synthase-related protein, partial [Burkholderia sp.]